jgi:hypothetical protein
MELLDHVRVLDNEYQVLCCMALRGETLEHVQRRYREFSRISRNGIDGEQIAEHWHYVRQLTREVMQ